MLDIDKTSKVIILPEHVLSLKILRIKNESFSRNLATSGSDIYELREVGKSSQFDSRCEPRLPSGDAVKSMVLESVNSGDLGAVIQNPNMIYCTKFNIAYLCLRWMGARDSYSFRYHTFDDLLDDFVSWLQVSLAQELPSEAIKVGIESICDFIQENEETFYKFAPQKAHRFLVLKILLLKDTIAANPDFAINLHIRSKLSTSTEQPPEEIIDLHIHRYSIDFVFGSYLTDDMKKSFLEIYETSFSKLDHYLAELARSQAARAAVDNNLSSFVASAKKEKATEAKLSKKARKPTGKKVAVGKGALDSFFSKQ